MKLRMPLPSDVLVPMVVQLGALRFVVACIKQVWLGLPLQVSWKPPLGKTPPTRTPRASGAHLRVNAPVQVFWLGLPPSFATTLKLLLQVTNEASVEMVNVAVAEVGMLPVKCTIDGEKEAVAP